MRTWATGNLTSRAEAIRVNGTDPEQTPRLQRTLQVFRSFEDEAESTRRHWWAVPPDERLRHVEELRRMNYGHDYAAAGLQRLLAIARIP